VLSDPAHNQAWYYPVGTVAMQSPVTDPQGCTITFNPPSLTIPPDPTKPHDNGGGLNIDYNKDPPTYTGTGITEWLATWTKTCPDGSKGTTQPVPTGGAWFGATGQLSADLLTIAGTQYAPGLGQTFTYSFTRPSPTP
jgi:hypothetical protein